MLNTGAGVSKRRSATRPQERQRAVRACIECRRLKEKCEEGIPCRRCRDLNRHCEYSATIPPSDRAKASQIERVGTLLERSRYMEAVLKQHLPSLSLDTESLRQVAEGLTVPACHLGTACIQEEEEQPAAGAEKEASPLVESPLDEVCTIDVMDDVVAHYSGELSHWNFSMRVKRNLDTIMATSQVPRLDREETVPEFIRVAEPLPGATPITDLLHELPPQPVANFLVHVFFAHATGFYFFLDQKWVMATLKGLYSDPSRRCSRHAVPACTVIMVLAVGAQYAHLESPGRAEEGPVVDRPDKMSWELEFGSTLYIQVTRHLAEMIHSGSLISVQACLLLGLYCLPIDASGLGYVYLNLAIKLAIQNGMHRKPVTQVLDALKEEARCRLWWTVYCLERKIGMFHGRPPAISRSDFDANLPIESPAFSSLSGSANVAYLVDAIERTAYLESFQHDLLLLRNCQLPDTAGVLDHLKKTKGDCTRWWRSRRGGRSETTAEPSRVMLHAQLEHCLLEMFVGRPFILTEKTTPTPPSSRLEEGGGEERPWSLLIRDCVVAAEEALDICEAMRTGPIGLTRSAYIEYSACRASLLVLLAYSIRERTNAKHGALRRGLNAIRAMAYAGDSARSEVQLIETLEAALEHINTFQSPTTTHLADGKPATADAAVVEGGYEGFMNWCRHNRTIPADGSPDHTARNHQHFHPATDDDDEPFFGQTFPHLDQVSALFDTVYGDSGNSGGSLANSLGLVPDHCCL
ncbi:fungal specific transcription factor [Geosmithia morbida]|uniref:Fungal specific transcription factor n=1 Tax=Geosmithia morbida TaxID=1094350 RepID=A0A9P5D4R7_9HYPO|nr:fungal specific transcription factor [Geosmithia morbida]KAF4123826.1 fungal specific transcription factor [Geosmithia morbida]